LLHSCTDSRSAGPCKYYNYFRDYDPQVGRFVESDPVGLRGRSDSTYPYVNDDPLELADMLGTKPGDSFPSAEAAAIDALNYINSEPDCATHEYAGWVYKEWSLFGVPSSYTYDKPTELGPVGGFAPSPPFFHGSYVMFHNHPYVPGYNANNYSEDDEDAADLYDFPSYLEIPSGLIKRYTPQPGNHRGGQVTPVASASCTCKHK
jgi:RHS repeat-associated protein